MQVITPLIFRRKGLFLRTAGVVGAMCCLILLLSQVAFARNTYVITDGEQTKVYTTYASDPQTVLTQAGFQLDDCDTYTTQAMGGVSEITVRRGQYITVHYGGADYQLHSYGEPLESLLNRFGISGEYESSLPADTLTYDGMEVTVSSVVRSREVYTVDVPYETLYRDDPTLPRGTERVIVAGSAGQTRCEADVVYTDARETARTVVERTVLQQPVNRVVAVGTGGAGVSGAPIIGDGVIVTASGEVLTYDRVVQMRSTAYTSNGTYCTDTTATGTHVRVGVVAVDPKVIPYGTRMFIVSNDGEYIYGIGTAEDCGGGIIGNRLDLYFNSIPECFEFGVRDCTVYILGN